MQKANIPKKQGIFIELDALLDTRLATLFLMNPANIKDVLSNGYTERLSETFFGVNSKDFKLAYSKRNKRTLANAGVTKVIRFVIEAIRAMNKQAIETPEHIGPRLIVNTYPYQLDESEANSLVYGIARATNLTSDIDVVYMEPKEVTPSWCKENISLMFIYDYTPWIELHAEAFNKTRIPDVTVIVPGIYFVREPTDSELAMAIRENMHPLRTLEKMSSVFVNLALHEINLFCLNISNAE
jgi:hypothetical protein